MSGQVWINLPSNNLSRAKKFFSELGFEINKMHDVPHMVSMFVGENRLIVNLFEADLFKGFMGGQMVTDTHKSNEILFSIGASSPEEVDALARKAEGAGAKLYARPDYKDEWMYGCGFIDLDGHRWNVLYMDMTKMPK